MKERVVYLCKEEDLYGNMLLFATKQGMMKLVDPIEFDVSKKTVAATKLSDGDEVLGVFKVDVTFDPKDESVYISHSDIVILTDDNYRLRFGVEEIPQKKKAALGVRTIKLSKDAAVKEVRIITKGEEPEIKTAHRDQRGSRVKG
jgi:DNA gyrase subunit A